MLQETWKELASQGGRCWARPLGNDEAAFYWDGEMNGACDFVLDIDVTLEKQYQGLLQNRPTVERAWMDTKERHPLMAAEIVEHSDTDIQFLVREERISSISQDEVEIQTVESLDGIPEIIEVLVNGPRHLRSNMLASVLIVSVPGSPNVSEHDQEDYSHFRLLFSVAHTIIDGMASWMVVATFLDALTRFSEPAHPTRTIPDSLGMVPAVDTLLVDHSASVARQRWRRAIAFTILMGRAKRQIVSIARKCISVPKD